MMTLISNTVGQKFFRGVNTTMAFNTIVFNDLGVESEILNDNVVTTISSYTFPNDGIKIPIAGVYYVSVSISFAAQVNLHPAIHTLYLYHQPEDLGLGGPAILATVNRPTISNFDNVALNLSTTLRLFPKDTIIAQFSIDASAPADLSAATASTPNCFDAHLSATLLTTI